MQKKRERAVFGWIFRAVLRLPQCWWYILTGMAGRQADGSSARAHKELLVQFSQIHETQAHPCARVECLLWVLIM